MIKNYFNIAWRNFVKNRKSSFINITGLAMGMAVFLLIALLRNGEAATLFAILAIAISCLGVFGLASFVAEQRAKEIGVRKVVGAFVFRLWKLPSVDFLLLVSIACLVASPVAYLALNSWLQQYAYRTRIPWWIFGVSITGALLLTLVVVSFQTFKAARMNPVDSLRDE